MKKVILNLLMFTTAIFGVKQIAKSTNANIGYFAGSNGSLQQNVGMAVVGTGLGAVGAYQGAQIGATIGWLGGPAGSAIGLVVGAGVGAA
jgi:uncharacterized protein YaaW (UPF0174 family)